jgi:hypothetical protein
VHALEAVIDLQVRKAHFDLLAVVAGFGELVAISVRA